MEDQLDKLVMPGVGNYQIPILIQDQPLRVDESADEDRVLLGGG